MACASAISSRTTGMRRWSGLGTQARSTGARSASEAVRQVCERAFGDLGLMRLEAVVRVGNEGSIKVLQRNGFREFGRSQQSFLLGGVWHDRLHFERRAG